MIKFELDIKTLLKTKLGFESYFVLYCLNKKNLELILSYTRECKKIDTTVFDYLATNQYIKIINKENNIISFNNLELTEKGKLLFSKELDLASAENEFSLFKNNYPSKVNVVSGIPRRLHGNKARCLKLFKDIRDNGVSLEDLSRCARMYIKEKKDSNSEKYIQLLETWLSKKIYEEYLNEEENTSELPHNNFDVI